LGVALGPASMAQLRSDAVGICRLGPTPQPGAKGARPRATKAPDINGDVYVLWRTDHVAPAVAEFTNLLVEWAGGLAPQMGTPKP
jgi:hypothetical protein